VCVCATQRWALTRACRYAAQTDGKTYYYHGITQEVSVHISAALLHGRAGCGSPGLRPAGTSLTVGGTFAQVSWARPVVPDGPSSDAGYADAAGRALLSAASSTHQAMQGMQQAEEAAPQELSVLDKVAQFKERLRLRQLADAEAKACSVADLSGPRYNPVTSDAPENWKACTPGMTGFLQVPTCLPPSLFIFGLTTTHLLPPRSAAPERGPRQAGRQGHARLGAADHALQRARGGVEPVHLVPAGEAGAAARCTPPRRPVPAPPVRGCQGHEETGHGRAAEQRGGAV
jgi:hypothetical protein